MFLLVIWSPKQSKNEGELYIVHGKAFGSSNSWRTKLWSSIALCHVQGKNNGERKNRVKKTYDSSYSLLLHFWSTSRSPFSIFYIPFQSSGSQESNASNGTRFGVETKELQPLQEDHSKLKEDFLHGCEISLWLQNDFAAILFVCEISQPFCAPAKFS